MHVQLRTSEVHKILEEKFGKGSFMVLYEEPDSVFEERTDQRISDLKEAPKKHNYQLLFREK